MVHSTETRPYPPKPNQEFPRCQLEEKYSETAWTQDVVDLQSLAADPRIGELQERIYQQTVVRRVFATYQTKSYEKLCHGDIQIPHRYRIGESDHEWSRKPSIQSLCHGALLNESQTGKNAISTVNGPSRESRLKGPRSTGQLKYSLLQPAT